MACGEKPKHRRGACIEAEGCPRPSAAARPPKPAFAAPASTRETQRKTQNAAQNAHRSAIDQRLFQIGNQVVDMLQPHRQPKQV